MTFWVETFVGVQGLGSFRRLLVAGLFRAVSKDQQPCMYIFMPLIDAQEPRREFP